MIDCIFTIDYEIYGNGEGSLRELVFEPARQLKQVFDRAGVKLVVYVEAAEFEMIERYGTDAALGDVKRQIREFYEDGYEIALHLHPQWYNARYENGNWKLDYNEYNLCPLGKKRITEIVERSIAYLRGTLGDPDYRPTSFRAGNWLFQPTATAGQVLAEHGVKIDSSVFKGGRQHSVNLDYRRAPRDAYYWTFREDAATPDVSGALLEIPIYTQLVPFWKMATGKRLSMQKKAPSSRATRRQKLYRLLDLLRFWHPLKFDFCRMTLQELRTVVESGLREEREFPGTYKPLVSIGHTKDLTDFSAVSAFLVHLKDHGIQVSTLIDTLDRCLPQSSQQAVLG